MKKQTTIPANQADFSTLEMWLNSESKLFTTFFADKGETISRKKALADSQLILSLVILLTFSFANPVMTLICALWFDRLLSSLRWLNVVLTRKGVNDG